MNQWQIHMKMKEIHRFLNVNWRLNWWELDTMISYHKNKIGDIQIYVKIAYTQGKRRTFLVTDLATILNSGLWCIKGRIVIEKKEKFRSRPHHFWNRHNRYFFRLLAFFFMYMKISLQLYHDKILRGQSWFKHNVNNQFQKLQVLIHETQSIMRPNVP